MIIIILAINIFIIAMIIIDTQKVSQKRCKTGEPVGEERSHSISIVTTEISRYLEILYADS